jgi:hypothetical protein
VNASKVDALRIGRHARCSAAILFVELAGF